MACFYKVTQHIGKDARHIKPAYIGYQDPPDVFYCTPLCERVGGDFTADLSQRHHLHLWEPGRSIPQTPDGPGAEADLPGYLQLH